MEFDKLVSSLDAAALAHAAEALLRLLSDGGAAEEGAPPFSASDARRMPRTDASFPPSASEAAARPLFSAEGELQSDLPAEEALASFAAIPGGTAAGRPEQTETRSGSDAERMPRSPSPGAETERPERAETRPGSDAERRQRSPSPEAGAAGELARLEARLAAVSERNRRTLGAETGPPYRSADDPATAGGSAAGAVRSDTFPAPRFGGFDAAAETGGADPAAAPMRAGAAERDYFDAEAVSEFFRRDSRRYDSGFSD